MNTRAFTLIELLIVVAIISILAGIAVPNFLEAQTRAKIARVQNDHRALATGLEAYAADYHKYPPSTVVPPFLRLVPLTTPVAYLSEVPADVFRARDLFLIDGMDVRIVSNYGYGAMPIDAESRWAMASVGPDLRPDDAAGIEELAAVATRHHEGAFRQMTQRLRAVARELTPEQRAHLLELMHERRGRLLGQPPGPPPPGERPVVIPLPPALGVATGSQAACGC